MSSPRPNDKIRYVDIVFATLDEKTRYLKEIEPAIITLSKSFEICVWPEPSDTRRFSKPNEVSVETNNYQWFARELQRHVKLPFTIIPSNLGLELKFEPSV